MDWMGPWLVHGRFFGQDLAGGGRIRKRLDKTAHPGTIKGWVVVLVPRRWQTPSTGETPVPPNDFLGTHTLRGSVLGARGECERDSRSIVFLGARWASTAAGGGVARASARVPIAALARRQWHPTQHWRDASATRTFFDTRTGGVGWAPPTTIRCGWWAMPTLRLEPEGTT